MYSFFLDQWSNFIMIVANPTTCKVLANSKKRKESRNYGLYSRKADKRRLTSSRSCIIPLGLPYRLSADWVPLYSFLSKALQPVQPPKGQLHARKDTPNASAKQFFLQYSKVLFAQKLQNLIRKMHMSTHVGQESTGPRISPGSCLVLAGKEIRMRLRILGQHYLWFTRR